MTELRDVTFHMGSQCSLLPSERVRPNPSQQAGTRFIYPRGMEGWVNLGYLAMQRPAVLRPLDHKYRRHNHYITEPPSYKVIYNVSPEDNQLL